MTKKEFEKIRKNNEKLKSLQYMIDDLAYKSHASGQEITGMPFVSGISDKVGDYCTRLAYLEDRYMTLLIRNRKLIQKAKRFLNEIPDYTIRLSLYFIYLKGMDTIDVADMMGIYGTRREKTLNKIINTFFLDAMLYM